MHYIWGIIKPFIFKLEVFCFEIIQGKCRLVLSLVLPHRIIAQTSFSH